MVMESETSILDKLDAAVPAPIAQFDAFPKLPSTYKARSESRGFMTLLIGLMAWLLMLNDIGEFIWGWPEYRFNVDGDQASFMDVNVDLLVNMPCKCEQLNGLALVSYAQPPRHECRPSGRSRG